MLKGADEGTGKSSQARTPELQAFVKEFKVQAQLLQGAAEAAEASKPASLSCQQSRNLRFSCRRELLRLPAKAAKTASLSCEQP